MKTIALSMIFSLAVIVCEQQTLFAPHIVTFDGLRAASPSNSLVPIAGVNRSVPLAGSGNGVISAATEFVKNDVWVVDTGGGLTSKNDIWVVDTGNGLQPIPDANMHLPASTPVERPVHGPIDTGCPPCDFELRLGLGGTAGPD